MRIFFTVISVVVVLLIVGLPGSVDEERPVSMITMFRDIAAFNGAVVGWSLLSSGYASGVGLELRENGSFERAAGEFARFWDYEYEIPREKMSFKKKNLLVTHPLMGYQFSNYLLARGYSRKQALITTALGVYVLEKGVQGSFETPTAYDLLSYMSGAVVSVIVQDHVESLYRSHWTMKPLAAVLNPFVVFSGQTSP